MFFLKHLVSYRHPTDSMPTALRQKYPLSHKGRSVFQVSKLSGRQNKSPSTPEMGQFNFIDLLDWVCLTMVYTLQNGQIDRETGDKSMIKHQIGSDNIPFGLEGHVFIRAMVKSWIRLIGLVFSHLLHWSPIPATCASGWSGSWNQIRKHRVKSCIVHPYYWGRQSIESKKFI